MGDVFPGNSCYVKRTRKPGKGQKRMKKFRRRNIRVVEPSSNSVVGLGSLKVMKIMQGIGDCVNRSWGDRQFSFSEIG